MNINQITIATIAVLLTTFTLGVTAEPGNKEKAEHEQRKDKLEKHHVVDSQKQSWGRDDHRDNDDRDKDEHRDNDGWNVNDRRDNDDWRSDSRYNENSNRQSDSDSTRGQERAAERHAQKADKHDRSDRESHWYDFIYGKDSAKADQDRIDNLEVKKPRWWWPFD